MTSSSFEDRFGEWSKFAQAISDQSTLGEVLITATFIEEQLGRILQSFLVEGRVTKDMVRGPAAVMGSFSAKTHLAYALGLIDDEESASIHAIRSIRNEFAHNIATDLDDQKVRSKLKPLCWAIGETEPKNYNGYEIFHLAAQRTIMQLLNRADHVMAERRQAKVWPVERTDYDPDNDLGDYIY